MKSMAGTNSGSSPQARGGEYGHRRMGNQSDFRGDAAGNSGLTRPSYCTVSVREFYHSMGCESGLGGRNGLQAPDLTPRLVPHSFSVARRPAAVTGMAHGKLCRRSEMRSSAFREEEK